MFPISFHACDSSSRLSHSTFTFHFRTYGLQKYFLYESFPFPTQNRSRNYSVLERYLNSYPFEKIPGAFRKNNVFSHLLIPGISLMNTSGSSSPTSLARWTAGRPPPEFPILPPSTTVHRHTHRPPPSTATPTHSLSDPFRESGDSASDAWDVRRQ